MLADEGNQNVAGRIGRAALVLSGLVATVGFFAVSVILPQIQAGFASDPRSALLTSLVVGVTPMVFAIASPLAGRAIDRLGYKRVYLLSLGLIAVDGCAGGVMPSLIGILATRIVMGVAIAGMLNAGLAGIGTLPHRWRAAMFGVQAFMGAAAGIFLFPLTGLLAHSSWRRAFAVYLVALLIIPMAAALPSRRLGPSSTLDSQQRARLPLNLLSLGAYTGMAMLIGVAFVPFVIRGMGITDPALVAVPLTSMSVVSLASSGCYGLIERRLGLRGTFVVGFTAIGLGLVAAGCSWSLFTLTPSAGLLGLGLGVIMPNLSAAAARTCPDAQGRALGSITACIYGVQALIPFALWPISGVIGISGTLAACGVLGLLLAFGGIIPTYEVGGTAS